MAFVKVVRAGMLTTVQDCGRWGFQARGVPVSGAMDIYSHRLANRLVGNPDEAATLEVTIMGPQIVFEDAASFAVAGANFPMTLDGDSVSMHRRVDAPAGSVLGFGARARGARAYLAMTGGVLVPQVLGSRSTHVLTAMGGFEGRALRAGDRIETGSASGLRLQASGAIPLSLSDGGARLRVLPGDERLLRHITSQRFTVSPRSDRMGYRLDGPPLEDVPSGDLISAAVATGALQVPPTGQPILLMADHATTGGYAVAATTIASDLPLAGQLAPGDWVEFELCTLAEADAALRDREAALDAV